MGQPVLTSERLTLRPFTLADAADVNQLAGNPQVSQSTLNIPYPYTLAMAKDWIETHADLWRQKSAVIFAIIENDTQRLIGTVALVEISGCEAELGYWIGQPYWGQGHCTEAVKLLMKYAVAELAVSSMYAEHLQTNPASGNVMRKNAMSYSGSIKKNNRAGVMTVLETYQRKFS